MQAIQLQNDSIIEIATFLIRRWSEKENITIEISDKVETITRLKENKVILTPLEKRIDSLEHRYGMKQCESNTVKKFSVTIMHLDLFSTQWRHRELSNWEERFGKGWMKK
jgi:hypothetical protein